MPGKIHVPVTVATAGFDAMQRQFSRLRGVTLGLSAAIGGLAVASKAVDFTGAAIQGARDLERNYAGLESVFKQNTDQMKEFGLTASEMGLSMNEAAKSTTFIGSVLKQSGFSIQQTSDLTEELVELGADLALTYGYDVQEALLGMTALFRGEYDPIEKFGVAMKQSEIDAEKAARGLDGLTGAAERFADQQIRVEFLMERASDAIGAFDRQSGNLTVQQMRLRAEFENVRDTIADDLLPPIADFTGGLREIVQDVGPKLENVFDRLAPIINEFSDEALEGLSSAIDIAIEFVSELIGFFEEAIDPTSDLNQSLGNAAEAVGSLAERVGQNLPSMAEQFDILAAAVQGLADALASVAESVEIVFGPLLDLFASLDTTVQAGTLVAVAAGLVAMKNGLAGIAAVFTKHPILLSIFAGTIVLGELGKQLQKDAEMTEKYRKTVENLDYTILENLSVQEEAQFQILTLAKSKGELNEVLAENPGFRDLAEKLGYVAKGASEAGEEVGDASELFDHLSAGKLPDYLTDISLTAVGAAQALSNLKEAGLDILRMELHDLQRFGAAQHDIDLVRQAIAELEEESKVTVELKTSGRNYVADFFNGIQDDLEKEQARLDLQNIGFSEGLIDQILASQGWEKIYDEIKAGGRSVAESLQADFAKTSAGIAEQQEALDDYNEKLKEIRESGKGIQEVMDSLTIDPSAPRAMGEFESAVVSFGATLEQTIEEAFGDDPAFADAKANLNSLAETYISALSAIERKRDQVIAKRDFASDIIFGTARAITAAGNITNLINDVTNQAEEIEITEVIEGIVDSADGLREFKTTITKNYTEVIEDTAGAASRLTDNFKNTVERTKEFLANLKLLKELGLDPMLFNQLVEAGAEAGGATAQALVEGGVDTINEVNSLQSELEDLGVEIGETTYEVTKDSGEQFVSGIIDGLEAQVGALETQAQSMADTFATEFATQLEIALQTAMDGITLPDIGELGGGGGGASVTPNPGDTTPGADTTFDGADVFKIRVPVAGTSLADLASQYEVSLSDLKKVNPKFFDPSHKDYDPGYQQGEYLYKNTLVNIPQLAEGGIALDRMIAMIGEAGPEAVIPLKKLDGMMNGGGDTYNINVTANTRAGGAAAGEEIVKALKAYQRQNGPIGRELTGFGA